jgi:hypothetical protein
MTEQTKVTIGGDERTVPALNGVRALEALRLVQEIMQLAPELMRKRAAFVKKYGEDNAETLTRGQAKVRFPPIPVYRDGELDRGPDGRPLTMESPIDRMSEHDWQSMGNVLVIPGKPSDIEVGLVMIQDVMQKALDPFTRLLGLLMARNDDVLTHMLDAGDLDDWLKVQGRDILHKADLDELIELVVVAIEVSNNKVQRKLTTLGERVGNVLSVFGLRGRLGTREPSTVTSTDSTDSPSTSSIVSHPSTDGMSDRSSDPVGALS